SPGDVDRQREVARLRPHDRDRLPALGPLAGIVLPGRDIDLDRGRLRLHMDAPRHGSSSRGFRSKGVPVVLSDTPRDAPAHVVHRVGPEVRLVRRVAVDPIEWWAWLRTVTS